MTSWKIKPLNSSLEGTISVPGDKSVSHRALLLSSIGEGRSIIDGISQSEDVCHTKNAMMNMGVSITRLKTGELEVKGVGLRGLMSTNESIDCGNSGTTMRLLSGLLAAQNFSSTLVGDPSLSKRPMKRVVEPLTKMGALISGRQLEENLFAPLNIEPLLNKLSAHRFEPTVASAQVKSAILIAGLYADGVTTVVERMPSRDHTEAMLKTMGAPIKVDGKRIALEIGSSFRGLKSADVDVPGDPSSAAFALVAAFLGQSQRVVCKNVGVWKRRLGFADVLKNMGCSLEISPSSKSNALNFADLMATKSSKKLNETVIEGELALRSIDEIPILALLASRADGETHFKDCGDLRFKESDRIASTVNLLKRLGVKTTEQENGFVVFGEADRVFHDAEIHANGDHRLAMTAIVAGFFAKNEVVVHGVETIDSSYKSFRSDMETLGATIEEV